jgi:hypothetical protein
MWEVRYEDVALDITGPERSQPHFLFYKTTPWKREQEVRIVLQQGESEKVSFNPRALSRIILGKNMSRSHEEAIRAWASSRQLALPVLSERDMRSAH